MGNTNKHADTNGDGEAHGSSTLDKELEATKECWEQESLPQGRTHQIISPENIRLSNIQTEQVWFLYSGTNTHTHKLNKEKETMNLKNMEYKGRFGGMKRERKNGIIYGLDMTAQQRQVCFSSPFITLSNKGCWDSYFLSLMFQLHHLQ